MTYSRSQRSTAFLSLLLLSAMISVLFPTPLQAADPQDNPSGFSFHKPKIFFGGHVGMNFPEAKGDIFGTTVRDLTLEESDFRAPAFGFDFGVYIHSHFAALGSFDYARTTEQSEYRHFIEDNGNSIIQKTQFSQYSLLGKFRYYPMKTGETIGSYSWVPTRFSPYIGAGMGLAHYEFSQYGDFVNSLTYNIFTDTLSTRNSAFMKQLSAGLDIALAPHIIANVEGRYSWAKGSISMGVTGYSLDYQFGTSNNYVDLNGLKAVGGIYFSF
jgi:opacity protein-like surface antigen